MKIDVEDQRHRAAEVVNLLVRAFNTSRTSAEGDDSDLKSTETELVERIARFFREVGSLILEIEPFALLWEGHLAYEDRDPESLPSILHRGGVGRIQFYPGIARSELSCLISILKTARGERTRSLDLIGRLQDEEELRYVDCIATDDYLEADPLPIPENLKDLREWYPRDGVAPLWQSIVLHEYCPGFEHDFVQPIPEDHSFRTNMLRILNQLYVVHPEEMEEIHNQIRGESKTVPGPHAVAAIFEVLLMEKDDRDLDRVLSYILVFLDQSLRQGDYQQATEVIKRLYTCLRTDSLRAAQIRRIKKAILAAGTASRIAAIADGINFSQGQDMDGLIRYLSLLQGNAVPHLCRLLGELEGSKHRRIICDALADLGRNSIAVFGAFLEDNRWYVVRNIVYVLGRIGKTECLPLLEKTLDHPDFRVRREAVRAISAIEERQRVIPQLIRKLSDTDGRVRGIAALQLARIGRGEAAKPLMDLVLSKAFGRRDVHEIRLLLQAIGMTGSDEAVLTLSHILMKKGFFGKTRADAIRRSAADALGAIRTPGALMALREISGTGDGLAREASRAALERIGA